jgi:hypothetical protein
MDEPKSLTLAVRRTRTGLVAIVRIISADGVLWRAVPIPRVTLEVVECTLMYVAQGVQGKKLIWGVLR